LPFVSYRGDKNDFHSENSFINSIYCILI
jgi:hypothetical protein